MKNVSKVMIGALAIVGILSLGSNDAQAKHKTKRILMTYQTKSLRTDHLDLYGPTPKYAEQFKRNIKFALKSLPSSTTKRVGAIVIAGKVTAQGTKDRVGVRTAKAENKVLMVNLSQYLNRKDINSALRRDIYNATRVNQMIVSTKRWHKAANPYKVLAKRVRYSGEPGEPGPINVSEEEAVAPIDGTAPIDAVEVPVETIP